MTEDSKMMEAVEDEARREANTQGLVGDAYYAYIRAKVEAYALAQEEAGSE